MSKVLTLAHADTPISGVTTNSTLIGLVNYKADHAVKEQKPNEALITNIKSRLDAPEQFYFAQYAIADAYKGTGIPVSQRVPVLKGSKVVLRHSDVGVVTDTNDVTYEALLPMSMTLTISVPAHEAVTDAVVLAFLQRSLAAVFETGENNANRLGRLVRGVALPLDLK